LVSTTRLAAIRAKYREDHQNPVNHVLHVGVGWPLCAVALLIVWWKPLWSVALVLLAYAIMFTGHFVFERNQPTILRHPTTPFVMAAAVVKSLYGRLAGGRARG
jgi:hypothetical protein